LQINSDVRTTQTDNISDRFQKTVNNKTQEHRTEEAPKALFWKSALIMTSRYLGKEPRLTGRRGAQLIPPFPFPCISSLQ
jgi:hypothetical protein